MNITKIQSGRPSKVYGIGRRCKYPGCGNVLSRYNPDDICASHSLGRIRVSDFEILQNVKICSTCEELKPATEEYYRKRGDRFEARCRVCSAIKRRERGEADIIKAGKRRCQTCKKIKPLDDEHYWRKHKVSYSVVCRSCLRKKWSADARESRKRKAAERKAAELSGES
jgi:hypothetical protein